MGPLEPSRDDLINQLSGSPSQPSAGAVAKSGFGAVASAVSPILGFAFNILSTMFSNSLTQQRASQQNAWNLAQWQRENAYNSPSAQMQRLAAAGVNPALAYANGDLMNEAASSPQLTSGQVFSPVQIDPLTAAQVANLDAQTRSTEHQTVREDEKQGLILQTMAADIQKVTSQINLQDSQASLNLLLGKESAQRVENLALQWKRDNESLQDYLRDMHAKADLSVVEAHYAAERISAAVESALAYSDYLSEQTRYIGYNAETGRIQAKTGAYKAAADVASDIRNWHLNVQTTRAALREARARITKYVSETKTIDQKRLGELINQYVEAYTDLKNANANMLHAVGSIIPG